MRGTAIRGAKAAAVLAVVLAATLPAEASPKRVHRIATVVATPLWAPAMMARDGDGNIYVAEQARNQVFRIAPDGQVTLVAGQERWFWGAFGGDGGPATDAFLNHPTGLALDSEGNLFIADTWNNRVRRVDAVTGVISTLAGNDDAGFAEDGGFASEAQLNTPLGLAVDAAGNLYLADAGNNRIRRVDQAGFITTVAGNGRPDFTGDGGPALDAALNDPFGVALDADGNLYLSDRANNRLRRVDSASGIITTIAGNGAADFAGDGGPATEAALNTPLGLDIDSLGNIFVADMNNNRVRRVSVDGTITTMAGNGIWGFDGDGRDAMRANLAGPVGVMALPCGSLRVTQQKSQRQVLNRAPTVVAQVVPRRGRALLNAGHSIDPDGDAISYEWLEGDMLLSTAPGADLRFARGPHSITLRVSDGYRTGSATFVVEVR
jgi:sugar lactone lactonase YvrE